DAAEDALATAEARRTDLERQLADATAEVTRLGHARDDAETTSDRAREILAAAQQHRREVGR
ncbi:hypothetical protein ACEN85_19315, partial [Curtobacterium sp. CT11-45]